MTADFAAVLLIIAAAPAATLFPVVYVATGKPWRSPIGRALMVSSIGLAALIDISLLYKWLGDDYALRDVVRLSVYVLIVAGVWMQFGALVQQKWHDRDADS